MMPDDQPSGNHHSRGSHDWQEPKNQVTKPSQRSGVILGYTTVADGCVISYCYVCYTVMYADYYRVLLEKDVDYYGVIICYTVIQLC